MKKRILQLSFLLAGLPVWGQVIAPSYGGGFQRGNPGKFEVPSEGGPGRLSPEASETIRRYRQDHTSPAIMEGMQRRREMNHLLRRMQERAAQCEGGCVSGGGDDMERFAGSVEEAEQLKAYQKSLMGLGQVHERGSRGQGIGVVVMDSGITRRATAYPKVKYFKDFTSQCPDGKACDESFHGTLVADLISQAAPEASLIVLKILSAGSKGKFGKIRKAFDWILDHHKEYNIRVVNMSILTKDRVSGEWNLLDEAKVIAKKLSEKGIILIAAVGNDYKNDFKGKHRLEIFPSSAEDVISVGSLSHQFSTQEKDWLPSDFSNLGYAPNPVTEHSWSLRGPVTSRDFIVSLTKPEVLAPGEKILACESASESRCAWVSGTSFASGLVTGGVASLLSTKPDFNREGILRTLQSNCHLPRIFDDYSRKSVCSINFADF